jgi:phosphoribosylaminoimidazolecarboxamide formyltransferase/IMP cyclohydrolase
MSVNFVDKIDQRVAVRHALISVSDKTGLEELVSGLVEVNPDIRIFSTGGTFARIKEVLGANHARNLTQVSDYTGQPETQGGLVKTLDFKIYLGLLTETYNEAHQDDLRRTEGVSIDLVVCNLYPFSATVAKPDATVEMARANVDIGGPCMIRAAAKNYLRVTSVTDPADYGPLLEAFRSGGGKLDLAFRFAMAAKAFKHTAEYDTAIAGYLAGQADDTVAGCYSLQDS